MKNKKKGYVLAIVIILTFVMTITVTTAFTIVMRYMFFAKNDLNDMNNQVIYNDTYDGGIFDARI